MTGVTTSKLTSGKVYIDIPLTNESVAALFAYANLRWDIFAGRNYGQGPNSLEDASTRNNFLFAVGIAGESLADATGLLAKPLPGGNDFALEKLTEADIKEIKDIRGKKNKPLPVYVDIGGEGRYLFKDKRPVLNLNIGVVASGKPIPNLIYGDATKLPFGKGTVDYIWIENPRNDPKWATEALRVIKPGGNIRVYTTTETIKDYLGYFTAVNPKLKPKALGDYLKMEDLGTGYDIPIPK